MKRHEKGGPEFVRLLFDSRPVAPNHTVLVTVDSVIIRVTILDHLAMQDIVSELVTDRKSSSASRLVEMVHDRPLARPGLTVNERADAARDVALHHLVDWSIRRNVCGILQREPRNVDWRPVEPIGPPTLCPASS